MKNKTASEQKHYRGVARTRVVTFDGDPLDPCFDIYNHSPNGFAWGYGGSGPSQLALALVMHRLQHRDLALRLYPSFKYAVVENLPQDQDWTLTEEQVDDAIREAKVLVNEGRG